MRPTQPQFFARVTIVLDFSYTYSCVRKYAKMYNLIYHNNLRYLLFVLKLLSRRRARLTLSPPPRASRLLNLNSTYLAREICPRALVAPSFHFTFVVLLLCESEIRVKETWHWIKGAPLGLLGWSMSSSLSHATYTSHSYQHTSHNVHALQACPDVTDHLTWLYIVIFCLNTYHYNAKY